MKTILEADDKGALRLPAGLLPHAAPHRRYQVEAQQGRVVVSEGEIPQAYWETASPAERAADLLKWASAHNDGPGLPDAAVGRDAIYD
jgi:hypothetical protein